MNLKREDFSDLVSEIVMAHREKLVEVFKKVDAQEIPDNDKHSQKVLLSQRSANLIWCKSYPHVSEIIVGHFDQNWNTFMGPVKK